MRHRSALTVLVATALVTATAACGPQAVSPLPVQAPSPTPSPTPSASPSARRTSSPRPAPTSDSSCLGAVRYDLDLQTTELALLKSLCFATGAVLRIQGIGPGEVSADPAGLVSQQYEAGVVDIRFVRPGTVTVTIPQPEEVYTITVVVR